MQRRRGYDVADEKILRRCRWSLYEVYYMRMSPDEVQARGTMWTSSSTQVGGAFPMNEKEYFSVE